MEVREFHDPFDHASLWVSKTYSRSDFLKRKSLMRRKKSKSLTPTTYFFRIVVGLSVLPENDQV